MPELPDVELYRHALRSRVVDRVLERYVQYLPGELERAGRIPADGATVFLHTGGIYGLFSFAAKLAALPASSDLRA